ncbi:CD99 antigen-like protein 2 [Labeo rohita]|uniref:CD99 antigen-like protein 2 n=1 Tax=Labeo rohita TaxID=84645 RepID=A0ABQ8N0C0_LABRO|nr:CD99 antigen-like protein 2 [Labeo rohita]
MTSHTWILLLLASLVVTRAQVPAKPTVKPAPPKNPDSGPAKPSVKPAPPKNPDSGFDLSDAFDLGGFDLSDAFGPDTETKKPVIPPKDRGTGGGTFDDKDLVDVNEGGEYNPDGGRSGGRGGGEVHVNDQSGGGTEQPQDLNQQWLQIIKMLVDNIPGGFSVWISQFNQVVQPLLEQLQQLLNITEEKTEL